MRKVYNQALAYEYIKRKNHRKMEIVTKLLKISPNFEYKYKPRVYL